MPDKAKPTPGQADTKNQTWEPALGNQHKESMPKSGLSAVGIQTKWPTKSDPKSGDHNKESRPKLGPAAVRIQTKYPTKPDPNLGLV